MKIHIHPSPTADTRTCDWGKVSREQLLASSIQHKGDIAQAIGLFQLMLTEAAVRHDFDKLTEIDHFHSDFQTGFKETGWWDRHRTINRHHLAEADGIPEDVNLIDVLDYIADCCMAGLARSGSVYELHLPDELLQRAFQNTKRLLVEATVIEPSPPAAERASAWHQAGCGVSVSGICDCLGTSAAPAAREARHPFVECASRDEVSCCLGIGSGVGVCHYGLQPDVPGRLKSCGLPRSAHPTNEEPRCSGRFSDARDCPVHAKDVKARLDHYQASPEPPREEKGR